MKLRLGVDRCTMAVCVYRQAMPPTYAYEAGPAGGRAVLDRDVLRHGDRRPTRRISARKQCLVSDYGQAIRPVPASYSVVRPDDRIRRTDGRLSVGRPTSVRMDGSSGSTSTRVSQSISRPRRAYMFSNHNGRGLIDRLTRTLVGCSIGRPQRAWMGRVGRPFGRSARVGSSTGRPQRACMDRLCDHNADPDARLKIPSIKCFSLLPTDGAVASSERRNKKSTNDAEKNSTYIN